MQVKSLASREQKADLQTPVYAQKKMRFKKLEESIPEPSELFMWPNTVAASPGFTYRQKDCVITSDKELKPSIRKSDGEEEKIAIMEK